LPDDALVLPAGTEVALGYYGVEGAGLTKRLDSIGQHNAKVGLEVARFDVEEADALLAVWLVAIRMFEVGVAVRTAMRSHPHQLSLL